MRSYSPSVLLLVFTIILGAFRLCTCRHISYQESDQRTQHLSAIPYSLQSRYDLSSTVYGVSHKLVPGGPNPLHN
ncbi:hypothetical protein MANES_06G146200v8 [Manihot esculenta]|uniref:Uncharacterized protein n=1 Tax=Manihot esculenta TaxID=3983 RepID=A0A2C9VSD5_MANES|nr:hypothetical protein MANES_06G146200v8 [Manihot esculenta]